jgi:hypothetical protein
MSSSRAKALLTRTAIELVAGKELLREKKKKLKQAKDPLVAANAKLEFQTIADAVDNIKEHRELLKQKLASPTQKVEEA